MNIDNYEPEASRLAFLIERDGLEEAVVFAARTKVAYRRKVLEGKLDTNMRRGFIESYLAFKSFEKDHA